MTKDKKQSRSQSRRAASKEALKQMHILLGGEEKLEISSDDDDVIEVEVQQPPKKKYKASQKKSVESNNEIVSNTIQQSIFELDVMVEELTPTQKSRKELLQKEEQELEAKIEELLRAPNTDVIYNGVCTTALEITEQLQNVMTGGNGPTLQLATPPVAPNVSQTGTSQSIILQQQPTTTPNAVPQSYQLVMDPRLGVIVGAVSAPSGSPTNQPLQIYQPKVIASPNTAISEPTPVKTRQGRLLRQVPSSSVPSLHKASVAPKGAKSTPNQLQVKTVLSKAPVANKAANKASPKSVMTMGGRAFSAQVTFRPSEASVEGGLNMGNKPKAKSIDLTGEDGPDSHEVSFNKLQGRTYPSLVVVARPHLRVKDLGADRSKLDVKVKSILLNQPTKFTEWLIQQGLVRSDQRCSHHTANALKLGMYSDASKFPYSGGYVWISECCPQRFVSVFNGSLFEGSQHPPLSILKLLYHWCCQTIVQNVTQWVKVDNLYVKGMYTWLRAICTVALHTHIKQLGGPGVKVQVGVISLGTTSQDGNKREVKVEVLGILENTTRHIRLRAVEPQVDGERNYRKRFSKILQPICNWVHPSSIIVTDLTVDKSTLNQMGFLNVVQSTSTDYAQSNRTIMEYLRRIVPRMFQNTLSLLSRQIIQQFLDELVWREWYGTTVLQCFDNLLADISEQTRYDSGQSLISRLNKVSANPFKNWAIPVASSSSTTTTPKPVETLLLKRYSRAGGTGRKAGTTPVAPTPPPVLVNQEVPPRSTSPDIPEQLVPLENYYYGTLNDYTQYRKNKVTLSIKCPYCKLTFNSNISLMNHLFKHAHNVSNDVQLCKYCLTIVPSGTDLIKHISTSHPDETKFNNGFVCLICEAQFRNPFILGKHMSKEHCPAELPYMCGTCNFRCSNHKQAVDHFYLQHEYGTTIQCPFCLKSTEICSGTKGLTQNNNIYFFIRHLKKHQKKNLAKQCGRCTLWFLQQDVYSVLKDHQMKMHISQRGKAGLMPNFAPRNGVMVPKSRMDKCPDDAKIINFSTLYFRVGKNLNCKECNKSLATPKHFASFESCQNPNCQYSTCCSNSMQEHVAKCKFLQSKLPVQKLPYEMFCICGYSDTDGNMMAKHLAICERKSAYPSKEVAKKATARNSMLDVLGLVRKPEEASTSSRIVGGETSKRSEPTWKQRGRPRKNVEKLMPTMTATSTAEDVVAVIDLNNDEDVKDTNLSDIKVNIGDENSKDNKEVSENSKEITTEQTTEETTQEIENDTINDEDSGEEKLIDEDNKNNEETIIDENKNDKIEESNQKEIESDTMETIDSINTNEIGNDDKREESSQNESENEAMEPVETSKIAEIITEDKTEETNQDGSETSAMEVVDTSKIDEIVTEDRVEESNQEDSENEAMEVVETSKIAEIITEDKIEETNQDGSETSAMDVADTSKIAEIGTDEEQSVAIDENPSNKNEICLMDTE